MEKIKENTWYFINNKMYEKIHNKIRSLYVLFLRKTFPWGKQGQLYAWKKVQGDRTLRLTYPLQPTSIVFDVGGFRGEWAENIYQLYKCKIYIFEPIPFFAKKIKNKFKDNSNIVVYDTGLGDKNEIKTISLSEDGSSRYIDKKIETIEARFSDIFDVISKHSIEKIDLIKMNIEGDEYPLLTHLIKRNWIKNIKNIQVQFHDFIPHAKIKRAEIQTELQKTHRLTYEYPFVWENWELKA